MNNNEPNKIVNNLYKRYMKLSQDCKGDASKYDYKAEEQIKNELLKVHQVVGAVSVMSKKSLVTTCLPEWKIKGNPFSQVSSSLY